MGGIRQKMLVAGAVLAVAGLAGCSSTVDQADVETSIKSAVDQSIPGAGPVTCPDDLAAEVGASLRCEFVVEGQPVDAVATITSIEGDTANYDITTEARPVAQALLEQKVAEQIGGQVGVVVESAACAGDLPPEVDGSVVCTLTAEGESADFTVTVTAVDGGLINYSIEPVA
ncbi:DUF4333 domain-containing protein [Pseudonocardia sp.]|uniref:DUF4333 domain-containing protein n=1 Tax=Pseudonocardia sp. TaxID=60912 RepID=UPI00262504B0|nr:DUF4333 domain-containing protein [Pseudonocardia sp.]